ncbi:Magnesium transporter MRS2-11, chloroplastic [Vitis vinifera]|uniref:Magnesium transporter MRS2-11, chloroplastic n=1 Tax=Vitis vinifera TaxID=29760 RepID=A0A438KFV5_VITVI|nr:Magnesium transporter MRS2-11, chloroplastic [Vitis vinifera]RVX20060.1 Magnesium transporter MRS2-11, chloroplastic [Vitis vinifera]
MPLAPSSSPHLLQFPVSSPAHRLLLFSDLTCATFFRSSWPPPFPISLKKANSFVFPISVRREKCFSKSTEEDLLSDSETQTGGNDDRPASVATTGGSQRIAASSTDSLSLGIREPVYEVVEVKSDGKVSTRKINRRQLLKSSGLRPRDIRSVDPSLWLTNSMPSLVVREHAILLNLGSLRAIAMQESVFIFDYNRKGGKAFMDSLLPRLNPKNMNGGPSMPFELEVSLVSYILEYVGLFFRTSFEVGNGKWVKFW